MISDKKNKKVLIIDDEQLLLKIVTKFLDKLEISSEKARSGKIGLEIFKKNPESFYAVILDYNLPGESSFKILEQINDLNPSVEKILSTGFSVDAISKEFKNIGIDGMLQKPYNFNQFKALIEKIN